VAVLVVRCASVPPVVAEHRVSSEDTIDGAAMAPVYMSRAPPPTAARATCHPHPANVSCACACCFQGPSGLTPHTHLGVAERARHIAGVHPSILQQARSLGCQPRLNGRHLLPGKKPQSADQPFAAGARMGVVAVVRHLCQTLIRWSRHSQAQRRSPPQHSSPGT
jgi:hypothetical protein